MTTQLTTEEAELCKLRNQYIISRSTGLLRKLNRFDIRSPYDDGYTRFQLDMRRKAEVLKYRSIGGGGGGGEKVGNLTKNQIWAQIARQRPTIPSVPVLVANPDICPTSIVITPSSSCDVPGRAVPLFLDPSIPLYNYKSSTKTNPYGITLNDIIQNNVS